MYLGRPKDARLPPTMGSVTATVTFTYRGRDLLSHGYSPSPFSIVRLAPVLRVKRLGVLARGCGLLLWFVPFDQVDGIPRVELRRGQIPSMVRRVRGLEDETIAPHAHDPPASR